jgi:hypothetical protein
MPVESDIRAGAALVNGADAFPDLERLRDDFDIIYLLDLCAGIEAAVLYDTLSLTAFGQGNAPILEPLAGAGVLMDARPSATDLMQAVEQVMARNRAASLMQRVESVRRIDHDDLDIAPITLSAALGLPTDLALEEDTGLTLVLPFRQTPIYLSIPSVEESRTLVYRHKLTLAARYAELKDVMLGFRREIAVHDLDSLVLPPLATEILARADTFDELGSIILEARDRYSGLRRRFRAVRELMASDETPYVERMRAKKDLDADMARLAKTVRRMPTLLEPVGDIEAMIEAAPGVLTGDLDKAAKLLGPIAKLFDEMQFRFRMRPLFSLVEYARNTSPADLAEATRILFKHDLDARDIARAHAYAASVQKYVPQPAAGDVS